MKDISSIRWGIVGTGGVAHKFTQGLSFAEGAVPYAIASRNLVKAQAVAHELGIVHAYGSYAELLADPAVDIVYIATPNHCHYADTLEALEAGKAVLCEKPFALNSAEAQAMVAKARSKGLFLMEALWTRFLPSLRTLLNMVQDGVIGDPRLLRADFGFQTRYDVHSRLFDPLQGGGSVYDIGVYPLFMAQLLLGNPESVQAQSALAPSGVDMTTAILLRHAENRLSQLTSSFALDLDTEAHLYGTKGRLVLHRQFHMPTALTLYNDTGIHPVDLPGLAGNGYQFQANAAMDCLRRGLIECPDWPHAQSLALMELMDRVYAQIGRAS